MSTASSTATTVTPAPPVRSFLRLVTIEHSVFALPFAYLAALTAMRSPGQEFVAWQTLGLITLAMVGARTFAMAANRIIDREIDAANPRTAQRELVVGTVTTRNAWIGAIVALVVFLASAAALGRLPLLLAPAAVVPMIVYPYAKRFTDFPHAVLALAQAVAPVGAWIAVTGHWSWHAVVLGVGVGLWIGGFDLVYACQDTESDREQGVRSFPARWGNLAALRTARVVHAVVFALYVWFGLLEDFGPIWYAGLAATAAAFAYQHAIVGPEDLRRVNRSFFTANGFVGLALGAAGALDLVLR
jgi:4-hydroxybenzoate polyprenyltransferase